jgi:RimJ/RimL family protein N-acetyltransferase
MLAASCTEVRAARRPGQCLSTSSLVGYLFTARGKHRITANCDARNAASAAVLEKLGMRREGHLRQSTWAKGEWTDDLLYALLHDEWQTGDGQT